MRPDFGATSQDYARHRAGFPDSLFERLEARGIGRSGQSIVDLGTGTGSLARGFALRGCRVVGIDPAEEMLRVARELDAIAGVRYRDLETFSYDVAVPYTPEAWRGRIRASAGVGGSMSDEAVERFDAELTELLASRFPEGLPQVPHRVFAVLARAPA